jgi:hypothetical protein
LLGAGVGSKWSLYPPGDTQFVPGRAVAVATVIDIAGKDSVAKVHSSTDSIPAGARAVALLPAPTGQRIPIRLLDMPPDRRAVVEQTLRTNIKDVDLVGPQQAARFSVDVEGGMLRLLASDGLQVVGTFPLSDAWGVGLATVLSRSAKASELLTIDNPSSQLRIDARVSAAERMKPTVTARGVKLIADTQAVKYRIRNPDKPRTEQNSLQLELRVNSDAYLTIIDVDSEGGINLLFPNSYQRAGFRRDGFIRANESVLIPDSLNPGNEAGFYWDYSPPIGTDTIRIFASTDMQTAHMIRERIKTLVASGEQDKAVKSRSLVETIQWLRDALASVAARGIVTVNDTTSHVPGNISSSEPMSPNSLPSPVAEPAMTISSSAPLADWTATSLIIVVSE